MENYNMRSGTQKLTRLHPYMWRKYERSIYLCINVSARIGKNCVGKEHQNVHFPRPGFTDSD
jgi:hypothetical protein